MRQQRLAALAGVRKPFGPQTRKAACGSLCRYHAACLLGAGCFHARGQPFASAAGGSHGGVQQSRWRAAVTAAVGSHGL